MVPQQTHLMTLDDLGHREQSMPNSRLPRRCLTPQLMHTSSTRTSGGGGSVRATARSLSATPPEFVVFGRVPELEGTSLLIAVGSCRPSRWLARELFDDCDESCGAGTRTAAGVVLVECCPPEAGVWDLAVRYSRILQASSRGGLGPTSR